MKIKDRDSYLLTILCFLILALFLIAFSFALEEMPTVEGFNDDPVGAFDAAWSIRSEPLEHLIIVDEKTGAILGEFVGNESTVGVPNEYIYLLEGAIVIHNHPPPFGVARFSDDDLKFAKWSKCDELWVATKYMCTSIDADGKIERKEWSSLGYG